MKKKNKEPYKGCEGNIVDSILSYKSDPIRKRKPLDQLPSSVDGIERFEEQQPVKKVRSQKKDRKGKDPFKEVR